MLTPYSDAIFRLGQFKPGDRSSTLALELGAPPLSSRGYGLHNGRRWAVLGVPLRARSAHVMAFGPVRVEHISQGSAEVGKFLGEAWGRADYVRWLLIGDFHVGSLIAHVLRAMCSPEVELEISLSSWDRSAEIATHFTIALCAKASVICGSHAAVLWSWDSSTVTCRNTIETIICCGKREDSIRSAREARPSMAGVVAVYKHTAGKVGPVLVFLPSPPHFPRPPFDRKDSNGGMSSQKIGEGRGYGESARAFVCVANPVSKMEASEVAARVLTMFGSSSRREDAASRG